MSGITHAAARRALRRDDPSRRVAMLCGLLVVVVLTAALFGGVIDLIVLVGKGNPQLEVLLAASLAGTYVALALATTLVHAAVTIVVTQPPPQRSVRAAFTEAVHALPRLAVWTLVASTLGLALHLVAALARLVGAQGPALVVRWPGVAERVVPSILSGRSAPEALRDAWARAGRDPPRGRPPILAVALPALPLLGGMTGAWLALGGRGGAFSEAVFTVGVVLFIVLVSGVAPFAHGHAQATVAARRALAASDGVSRHVDVPPTVPKV